MRNSTGFVDRSYAETYKRGRYGDWSHGSIATQVLPHELIRSRGCETKTDEVHDLVEVELPTEQRPFIDDAAVYLD